MLIYAEGATQAQEDEAEMILEVLSFAYPGHPWGVRVYDGGFFIRHLAFPANWGMNCKYKDVSHDAAVLKRAIIRHAGEWLERAGLARGRYDADQEIERVEGVPERFQPGQKLPDNVSVEIAPPDDFHPFVGMDDAEGFKYREVPRPQALKAANG